jgi:hypothetical protein
VRFTSDNRRPFSPIHPGKSDPPYRLYRKNAVEDYIFSGRTPKSGFDLEKYLIRGSGDYYLPVLRLLPSVNTKGQILFLTKTGKPRQCKADYPSDSYRKAMK